MKEKTNRIRISVVQPLSNGADRNSKGQFKTGNGAARGRRKRHSATIQRVRSQLFSSASEEQVKRLLNRIWKQACSGGFMQQRLLLSYLIGAVPTDPNQADHQFEQDEESDKTYAELRALDRECGLL